MGSTQPASSGRDDTALYDETFTITSIDAGKYERVARLNGSSTGSADTAMTLDINTELYPVNVGEVLQVVLAATLSLDPSAAAAREDAMVKDISMAPAGASQGGAAAGVGTAPGAGGLSANMASGGMSESARADVSAHSWRDVGRPDAPPTLADLFDYVCRGKIYRFEEGAGAENL